MVDSATATRTESYGRALLDDTARDRRRQRALGPTRLAPHQVLESEGFLFLRYRRR